jgi:CheY-like chemotaxis protein
LIIEDDDLLRDGLTDLLKQTGHTVCNSADGLAAQALLNEQVIDAVLLDLGLPKLDGLAVARRLRQDERFASLRIVALTGWGQDSDRRQTRNRGFTYHLTKPVSLEDLHKILI